MAHRAKKKRAGHHRNKELGGDRMGGDKMGE
jgi:hypothetical protein